MGRDPVHSALRGIAAALPLPDCWDSLATRRASCEADSRPPAPSPAAALRDASSSTPRSCCASARHPRLNDAREEFGLRSLANLAPRLRHKALAAVPRDSGQRVVSAPASFLSPLLPAQP